MSTHEEPSAFAQWMFKNRFVWLALVVVLGVAADQASKIWAQGALAQERTVSVRVEIDADDPAYIPPAEGAEPTVQYKTVQQKRFRKAHNVVVIPNAFQFSYAENEAAAFSLTRSIPLKWRRPLLLAASLLGTLLVLGWFLSLKAADGLLLFAFPLIVSGAIGNFIDRVRLKYVIDFIDVYAGFINPSWLHWPTFNIADICIVVGALAVLLRTFTMPAEDEEDAAA